MTIRQQVDLPSYAEIRAAAFKMFDAFTPSIFGIQLVAAFQQVGSYHLPYVERREALLSARAKFSYARHLKRTTDGSRDFPRPMSCYDSHGNLR